MRFTLKWIMNICWLLPVLFRLTEQNMMSILCSIDYSSGLRLQESTQALQSLCGCLGFIFAFLQKMKKTTTNSKQQKRLTIRVFSLVIRHERRLIMAPSKLKQKHVNTAVPILNIIHDPQAMCSDVEKTMYFHVLCTSELLLQDQDGYIFTSKVKSCL